MRRIITNRTSNPAHLFQVVAAARELVGQDNFSESFGQHTSVQVFSLPLREEPRLRGLVKPQFWRLARCSVDPVVKTGSPTSDKKEFTLRFRGARKLLKLLRVPAFLLFFSVRGTAFDSFYFAKPYDSRDEGWEHLPRIVPFHHRILHLLKGLKFLAASSTLSRSRPMSHVDSILLLEYRGIVFGDLMVAHGLRYDRKAGGDPTLMRGVRRLTLQAVAMIETAMAVAIQQSDLFFGDEHTYMHWIYARCFSLRGVPLIGFVDGTLRQFETERDLVHSRTTIPRETISKREREQAQEVLSRRTTLSIHDKRFGGAAKSDIASLLGIPSCQYVKDPKSIPRDGFVILAHSFHDGLFYYGRDDFTSVFDWMSHSIALLTQLRQNVLIKLHPNADYQRTNLRYSTDVHALRHISRVFQGSSNLFYIDPYVTLSNLEPSASLRFVTRHGSGAAEVAYLGFLCISSSKSPWETNFSFSKVTSSRSELDDVIHACSQSTEPLTVEESAHNREEAIVFTALELRRQKNRLDLDYSRSIGLSESPNPSSIYQLSLQLRSSVGFGRVSR